MAGTATAEILPTYKNIAPYTNKYHVVLSSIEFSSKPKGGKDYGRLHKDIDSAKTTEITFFELMEAISHGRAFKNGIHVKPSENYHAYKIPRDELNYIEQQRTAKNWNDETYNKAITEMKKALIKEELKEKGEKDEPQLIYTRLAILDIDDVIGKVQPAEIMREIGAVGLYYTYSHNTPSPVNTTMFRSRLVIELSEPVKSAEELKAVQQAIKEDLLELYPYLNDQKFGDDKAGKSKSHGIENLTKTFLGTNKGYEINENYSPYDVTEALANFKKEKQFNHLLSKVDDLNKPSVRTTAEEIIDIAEFLGDMNDENLPYSTWTSVAIGLWNTAQMEQIDDAVILEALKILDGNRESDKVYMGFKKPLTDVSDDDRATIGTLILLAKERGYKRVYVQQPENEDENAPQVATQTHYIDEYVNKDDIYKLLTNNDKRILVQSDTNTGKTTATIEACKEYLKNNPKSFVYFATPTQSLSEQATRKFNLNKAIVGNMNVNKAIQQSIFDDSRLLAGTYDKAEIVHSLVKGYRFIVIADEAHKEVIDYNYRPLAIQSVFDIEADKFIGLTGTPSEIDLSSYDSMEAFKLKEPKTLADTLQFIEYNNANHYDSILLQAIELEVKKGGNKVLAFVNNKRLIKKYAQALRKTGVKVSAVTSDSKKSRTYTSILENQKLDDDVDVVLTTIVLADGISIQNTHDYVCVIAPSHYKSAMMYNIDTIRQATNRFRSKYKKILIPFYVKSDLIEPNTKDIPRTSDRLYNLENQYNNLMRSAEISKALLMAEFDNNAQHFTPSIAEKLAGLFRPKEAKKLKDEGFNFAEAYENKRLAVQNLPHNKTQQEVLERLEAKMWTIDKRAIRQQASEDKQNYYAFTPHAFKRALTQALDVENVEEIKAHEYLLKMEATHEIVKVLKELDKLELETEREKRENVEIILHELIYTKIQLQYMQSGRVDESREEWKLLKDKMASWHYNALKRLVCFMNYEEAINELKHIKKKDQINELTNGFNAITELKQFEKTSAETITELIVKEIFNGMVGKVFYSKKERDEARDELAKNFKIKKRYTIAKKKKLFEKVLNSHFAIVGGNNQRIGKRQVRPNYVKLLDFDDLAKQRETTTKNIRDLYKKYLYSKGISM